MGPSLEEPVCAYHLQKLRDLRAPASRTLTFENTTRFLAAGVHALPAIRKACDAMAYASKVAQAELVLEHAISSIVLAGGDEAEAPARIAKARSWYAWQRGRDCTDGRTKYIVRRYDFDAKQRITKEAVKEYCGQAVYE